MNGHPSFLSYDRKENAYQVCLNKQLQTYVFQHNSLKLINSIKQLNVVNLSYNFYLGLLVVLDDDNLYVIEQGSCLLTHIVKMDTSNILRAEFITGTNSILCVARNEIQVLSLTADGGLYKKYKVPFAIEDDEIVCYKMKEEVQEEGRIVSKLELFIGMKKGKLVKLTVKNINLPILESRLN